MRYESLFAFATFADHLNFTRTAVQLHISQPALYVQIKKLEEAVGRPLYRRNGRVLALTAEGKRLAAFGREIQEMGRSVLEEIRGQVSSGPVVLASGPGAFLYLLGAAVRRFPKEKWPLRLISRSGPEAIEAVREAKAHLCVVGAEDPPADLSCTPLRSIGQKVVLPSSHRLARRRSIRPGDLRDEKLVVAPAGSPHRMMLQQLLRANDGDLAVAVEATGWELMLHFARQGVGITVVNDFCPTPKGLVGLPLEGAPRVTYYLITREGAASAGLEVLRTLILETVRRD